MTYLKKTVFTSDFIILALLILGAISTSYLLPNIIAYIYFYSLLLLFYRSPKNYLWLAFVFILVDPPGGFFPPTDLNYGLPPITTPFFISYQEVFLYLALFKSLKNSASKDIFFLKTPFTIFFIFVFILLIYTLLYGVSAWNFARLIKFLLPWTALYSFSKLLPSMDDWIRFFKLVFPFVFISFALQLLHLYLNTAPAFLLGTDFVRYTGESVDSQNNMILYSSDFEVYRLLGSYFLSFISLIAALFFISMKSKPFSDFYLTFVILVSLQSILLSATRGLILGFFVGFILFLLFVNRSTKLITNTLLALVIFSLFTLAIPQLNTQINAALERFATVGLVFQGDLSAGGTNARLDRYTPELLEKFYDSPILGLGFSNDFFIISNPHSGLANQLVNSGILGFIVFIIFWIQIAYIPYKINLKLSDSSNWKDALLVFPLGLVMLLVIHSTSGQQFAFDINYTNQSLSQLIYYVFLNSAISQAIKKDQYIAN